MCISYKYKTLDYTAVTHITTHADTITERASLLRAILMGSAALESLMEPSDRPWPQLKPAWPPHARGPIVRGTKHVIKPHQEGQSDQRSGMIMGRRWPGQRSVRRSCNGRTVRN